ncbi:type II toxin-antitoxin system RelE/ParE family toxin [Limnohabitans planktonicus]|uniref:type II toxin-antitoxin system RelE/ParE family toxin n=1 Tax=Limnohabitans planktonicus TaxID=540060 RepID=UPI00069D7BCC|nr:type II toxin-antitoxin system RelE/ParE family toxin [Limnohabitans planktonicus]
MPEVSFAQSAQTDLLEAWSFIAEESFEAADHVLEVIEKEALTLALQPLMGRARPELNKEVRCWPTSAAYNLYYVASDSGITVIRVLHHARDVNSRLF